MVYGPRAGVGTWLTGGFTVVVLCLPIVLVLATPSLAQPPPAAGNFQPVALTSAPAGRLDAQLTELPIIVSDFPDEPSRKATSEYADLRLQQPNAVFTMLEDTFRTLVVNPSDVQSVNNLGNYLVYGTLDLPDDRMARIHDLSVVALPALSADPHNADRMSNVAVLLFELGVTYDQAFITRSKDSNEEIFGSVFEDRARDLLHEMEAVFPSNRAVVLNSAYLKSVQPGACITNYGSIPAAVAPALQWLHHDPGDITARLLVASLQSRDVFRLSDGLLPGQSGEPAALADALATLGPLVQNSSTAGLGYAATGDAYLAAAGFIVDQAPYEARFYAGQARASYEKARSTISDPGVMAGEAAALKMLGDSPGALAMQNAAVSLAPDSIDLLLGLASVQESNADFRGMRESARKALSLALSNQNQSLHGTRFVASRPGALIHADRGFLGYSVGSDRARTTVANFERGCGAGGFTLTTGVPAVDNSYIEDERRDLPASDAAVLTSLDASLALSQPDAALADVERWKQAPGTNTVASQDSVWLDRVNGIEGIALQAVYLSVDQPPQSGTDMLIAAHFAESHLRHSALVSRQTQVFALAAALCHRQAKSLGDFRGFADPQYTSKFDGLLCEGESAYYAGDYAEAKAALGEYYSSDNSAGTEAALALWKANEPNAAHDLLLKLLGRAQNSDPEVPSANETLGELLLDGGDPRAAIDDFQRVVNGLQEDLQPGKDIAGVIRALAGHAFNNHGIALLWRAEHAPGTPPDCGPDRSVCKRARDDFANALSLDPHNPYYLQNGAWADQLLGSFPAAKAELKAAATADPADYPALNDLGVMAAKNGDLAFAQSALESSLRARPDYDLAAWNLGVVEMQEGSTHLAAAQAYLARATRKNPSFRLESLDYRVDNRVYRVAFGKPLQPVLAQGATTTFSQAAEATGGIAMVSALDDVLGIEIKHKLVDVLHLRLPFMMAVPLKLRGRVEQMSRYRRIPAGLRTWVITGLTLAIVTTWAVWSKPSVALWTEVAIALLAAAIALLVHETGHLVAACLSGIRLEPAPSPLGTVVSVLLVPLHSSTGPYAGHRSFPATPWSKLRWVYLAGPVANLAAAALAYGLYLAQPLPFLRVLTAVQLAAAAFSLMPFEPLDGAAFGKSRKERSGYFSVLPVALAFVAALGGLFLTFGRL